MSFFSKLSSHHSAYIARFYNKKLAGVGSFVGACCGLTYLTEYYGKQSYNNFANEWNSATKQQNRKRTSRRKIFGFELDWEDDADPDDISFPKIVKYKNPFSLIIISSAPYSVNMLTTMITGGGIGYLYAVYFPISIPATVIYNLTTYNGKDELEEDDE